MGLDGSGNAVSVAVFGPLDVPHSNVVVARVSLVPADPLGAPSPNEHVLEWQRPMGTDNTKCVVVEHPSGSPHTEFFVPNDDTDPSVVPSQ